MMRPADDDGFRLTTTVARQPPGEEVPEEPEEGGEKEESSAEAILWRALALQGRSEASPRGGIGHHVAPITDDEDERIIEV